MTKGLNSPHSENLPVPISTFIGRKNEIVAVKQLILKNRLVTLTGAGGSGKTRLALKIAHELLEKFNNSVWFIELASLTDPSLISQKIASTLNIREQSNQPLLDSLIYYLSRHPSLLVLDNCEHLIAACAEIANILLQKCADLKILTTSREVLGITGEVTWIVPPLSLPEAQPWRGPTRAQEALDEYQKSESVQLFIDRATTYDPGFELTSKNGAWVAEICRRLDGMPLAIELAAARVRTLSAQQIAERLDDRFGLLTAGSHTAASRHQTLAATIEWSYTLLSEKEQILLQRFSVFPGGGTLKAIESVCIGNGIKKSEVLDTLSQLVDKSLVVTSQISGKKRYSLLETIREFALEKLAQSQEMESTKNRHLDFYLQFVEEAEPKIKGPEELIWYARLEAEHDNLRAALGWALESRNAEAALKLASSLSFFWFVQGHMREGIIWLEKALEKSQGASLASRAKALRFLGGLLISSEKKDFDQISKLFKESLELYRKQDNQSGIAWILNQLGVIAMMQGEFNKAKQLLEESLALRKEIGDPWDIAQTLQNFAPLSLRQNDYASAREFAEKTITWFQRAGYKRGVVRTSMDLAEIARLEGDSANAVAILTKALPQFLQFGDRWSSAEVLESLATLTIERSKFKQAAQLFGMAEALREKIGMPLHSFEYGNYQKDILTLRKNLNETEFSQAWRKGRAIPLEKVIEFVSQEPEMYSSVVKKTIEELTAREREAAILIAQGMSNREIADAMTVTVKTVEANVTRILRKLGFDSRVQIATWVIDNDLG
jgi:non-specific serine/threonine protein kinase